MNAKDIARLVWECESDKEIAKLIWELEDTARWLDTQAERIAAKTTDERVRGIMAHQFAGRAGLIRQIIAIAKREGGIVTAEVIREVQAISPQP